MSLYRAKVRNQRTGEWEYRGSWIVERKLFGVEVRTATGIYEREAAEELEETLLRLAKHGRRDLIVAFDKGHISGPELWAGVDRHGISFQLSVERALPLSRALERWLEEADLTDKTKGGYRYSFEVLQRGAKHPVVGDLPDLLMRYARRAPPIMFQRVKAACQAFVRDTVPKGRQSELWRDVAGVRGPRAKRRNVQGGLTPDVARVVSEKLGRLGPMWWTLCCTGMGPREYWVTSWRVLPDRIVIEGTKRERRQRIVPLLTTPVRPFASPQSLAAAIRAIRDELGLPRLTIYAARRTFAHWLERAKIDDSRCDAYMGHAPQQMRSLYREHDVAAYLAADAKALREVIGADPLYVRALA